MPWHVKTTGNYTTSTPVYNYPDQDGIDNCFMAWNILSARGWTRNAVAGLLTCVAFESGYNPWQWQNDHIFASTTVDYDNYPGSVGYGLVQWTPASYMNHDYYTNKGERPNKYINNPQSVNLTGYGPNFSDIPGNVNDGTAQLVYLDSYGWVGQYFDSHNYYGHLVPNFQDFKTSTLPASDLCEAWTQNFERAGGSYDPTQRSRRQALAPELYQLLGGTPPASPFPAWLLMKWRQDNMRR